MLVWQENKHLPFFLVSDNNSKLTSLSAVSRRFNLKLNVKKQQPHLTVSMVTW